MLLSIVVASGLLRLAVAGEPLKQRLPFYHSSDELASLLEEAVHECKTANADLKKKQVHSNSVSLDVITISAKGGGSPKPKAVFVFGEHARELVSSESGLHFVQSLCGISSADSDKVQKALAHMDLVIIPNANPQGRRLVENGSFCKRTNENGVDLNRNWGNDHRDAQTMRVARANLRAGADDDDAGDASEENPGMSGFSEPESEIVREIVEQSSPKLFLSVHSGAYLLGLPYGFSISASPPNADTMNEILSSISTKYCGGQCPYGNLARTIGYTSAGCSVDYVTDHMHVPFAFTWEIYSDTKTTAQFAADAKSNEDVKQHRTSAWSAIGNSLEADEADIRQMQTKQNGTAVSDDIPMNDAQQAAKDDTTCLTRFNPQDEVTLSEVLETWSKAYLDLAEQVASAQVLKATAAQSQAVQDEAPTAHAQGASEWLDAMKTQKSINAHKLAEIEPDHSNEMSEDDMDKFEAGVPSWDAMSSTNKWRFLHARAAYPSQ